MTALDRPWRRPGALRYALNRIRGVAKPPVTVTDPPADLHVERDVAVPTRDATVLRINVFRKADAEPRPVILSIHPYGKDSLPKRRGNRWTFSAQYRILRQPRPVTFSALTGWEAPDPAWWTAQGFVVVNADSRGCGRSEGTGNLLSHREAEDTYDLVQWVAGQPWSDGNVVMLGVSYLAISQYAVAALQPPALRAICPWEGFTDAYRDLMFPGGVRELGFIRMWSRNVRRDTRQAYDLQDMQDRHPLRDEFWRSLVPDLSAIAVPMLVCGSFSDNNLHSRGSLRAFTAQQLDACPALHPSRRQVGDLLRRGGAGRTAELLSRCTGRGTGRAQRAPRGTRGPRHRHGGARGIRMAAGPDPLARTASG
jgi:putative CocE/NonD family hydrolase